MTTTGSERTTHAAIAEEALRRVFDSQSVAGLREDSPLAMLGMTSADVVCLADAVARAAQERSVTCMLGDADLAGLTTVADLIDAVAEGTAR